MDLFGGSFCVTLNKPQSKIETVNDIDGNIVNFFKVLRDDPDQLIRSLLLSPYSREEYTNAWYQDGDSDLERARKFFIRQRQSFGSMGSQKQNKGWNMAKYTSRCKVAESVNRWLKGTDKLYELVDRLKVLQIENKHFRDLVPTVQSDQVFIYADPPYDGDEIRTGKDEYLHDFDREDHEELATHLQAHPGRVAISGYNTSLMKELYEDWYFVEGPERRANISKSPRQECLWTNYDPFNIKQQTLFN